MMADKKNSLLNTQNNNVVWHHATVNRLHREKLNGHHAVMLWFTGLSGAGKSTLAHSVEEVLHHNGCRTYVLDGDNVRHGLNSDLGFSIEDRAENLRRIGEICKLFIDAGVITLAAFISPLQRERERVRSMFPHGDFLEIYCSASLELCEQLDPKGIYRRARAGEIPEFTGITSPYEPPLRPELEVNTGELSLKDSIERVTVLLKERRIMKEHHSKNSC